VSGAVGLSPEFEVAAAFKDPIEDGLHEVGIVEDAAPGGQRVPSENSVQLVETLVVGYGRIGE
jgi:hypothetical protein